ncbi:hypothetical protein ACFLYU_00765 [Candidatus Dependentiae bacterium]
MEKIVKTKNIKYFLLVSILSLLCTGKTSCMQNKFILLDDDSKVLFTPDKKYKAVCTQREICYDLQLDNKADIIETKTNKKIVSLELYQYTPYLVEILKFSPNSKYLAYYNKERALVIMELGTKNKLVINFDFGDRIEDVQFAFFSLSPRIAVLQNNEVTIHNLTNKNKKRLISMPHDYKSFANLIISPKEKYIMLGGRSISFICSLLTKKHIKVDTKISSIFPELNMFAFSNNDKFFAYCPFKRGFSENTKKIITLHLDTSKKKEYALKSDAKKMAFNKNSELLQVTLENNTQKNIPMPFSFSFSKNTLKNKKYKDIIVNCKK